MTYLRDVNALVGLDSSRIPWSVAAWLRAEHFPSLATCSITELGFLRVLAQAPGYGFTFAQARILLLQMKKAKGPEFTFIADDHDVSLLPAWVKTAGVDYGRTSAEASWRKASAPCNTRCRNPRSISDSSSIVERGQWGWWFLFAN